MYCDLGYDEIASVDVCIGVVHSSLMLTWPDNVLHSSSVKQHGAELTGAMLSCSQLESNR